MSQAIVRSRRPRRRFVSRDRRLAFEPLESRRLLAVNWRNPVDSLDVNADGSIAAQSAGSS